MASNFPSSSNEQYRPDIDGLRAFAVLSVVLYHAFPKAIGGGFVGVDVFFVISDFLISSILLKEMTRRAFRSQAFTAGVSDRSSPPCAFAWPLCWPTVLSACCRLN